MNPALLTLLAGACAGGPAGPGVVASSGIAFTVAETGRAYVLSLETPLRGECAWAERAPRPPVALAPVASDWGWGLALHALADPDALGERPPALPIPATGAPASGAIVTIAGASGAWRVLLPRSDRHALPALTGRTALELRGDPVSSSFAGAPITDASGAWLGLLTEQALELRPGEPTRLVEWEFRGGDRPRGHLVALPAAEAAAWVAHALSSSFTPYARRVTLPAGGEVIDVGRLRLSERCPAPGPRWGARLGDFPIGGVDGAGVGGGVSSGRVCKLEVALAESPGNFPISTLRPWADALATRLQAAPGTRAEVWYLAERPAPAGHLRRRTFGSLREWLRDLQLEPALTPISLVWAPGATEPGEGDPALAAYARTRAFARWYAEYARALLSFSFVHDSDELLLQTGFLALVLQSDHAPSVTLEDLRIHLDDPAWRWIENATRPEGELKAGWASLHGELAKARGGRP